MDARLRRRIPNDPDGFARALARSGIGLGALPAHRQPAQVPDAAITFNTLQPFQIHSDLAAEITLDNIFAVLNGMDDLRKLLFSQILGANARIDVGFGEYHFGIARAKTVNRSQRDLDPFIGWDFYSDDAGHTSKIGLMD